MQGREVNCLSRFEGPAAHEPKNKVTQNGVFVLANGFGTFFAGIMS